MRIHTDGRRRELSGYSYLDPMGNLFVSPATAGSPILEYGRSWDAPPSLIHVPGEFAAQRMVEIPNGSLFVAGTTFTNFHVTTPVYVYSPPYTEDRSPVSVTIPAGLHPVKLAYDKNDNLFVLAWTKDANSRVLIYRPPYKQYPFVELAMHGMGDDMQVDEAGNLLIFVRLMRGGRPNDSVVYEPKPYRTTPTTVLSFKRPLLSFAFGPNNRLVAVEPRVVSIYSSPYTRPPNRVQLIRLGVGHLVRAQVVAFDADADLFLLAVGNPTVPRYRYSFGIWEVAAPYSKAVWHTALTPTPKNQSFGAFLVYPLWHDTTSPG